MNGWNMPYPPWLDGRFDAQHPEYETDAMRDLAIWEIEMAGRLPMAAEPVRPVPKAHPVRAFIRRALEALSVTEPYALPF